MASDYASLLNVIANPQQFPEDCIELDYAWDGLHLHVTLRWRDNPSKGWMYINMMPLTIGNA